MTSEETIYQDPLIHVTNVRANALSSRNRDYIAGIVNAMNEAIVRRG